MAAMVLVSAMPTQALALVKQVLCIRRLSLQGHHCGHIPALHAFS